MVIKVIIIMEKKVIKKKTMKIMGKMGVTRMAVLIKMGRIMDRITLRMDPQNLQLVVWDHQNRLNSILKSLKKLGILRYLENLVILILLSVLDIIW
jgi:hypothetical protein